MRMRLKGKFMAKMRCNLILLADFHSSERGEGLKRAIGCNNLWHR